MKTYACIVSGLLVLSAGAQSVLVSPPRSAGLEGYSGSATPFARLDATGQTVANRQYRHQQVHDQLAAFPLVLKEIAFRRDAQSDYDWPSWKAELELTLATAAATGAGMSKTFAANAGPDATVVLARKWISFPPSLALGIYGLPFAYRLPFDTGKVFLLGPGKPLLWDVTVFDNDVHAFPTFNASFDLEYAYLSNYAYGVSVNAGRGCWAPMQTQSAYCGFSTRWDRNFPGREVAVGGNLYYGPSRGTGIALLALREIGAGIPIGAPGCSLFLDPGSLAFVSAPIPLNYLGSASWGTTQSSATSPPMVALPDDPLLYGCVVLGQMLALDQGFNLYFTNFSRIQLPYPWQSFGGLGINTCYATDINALSGTLGNSTSSQRGLVTAFTY